VSMPDCNCAAGPEARPALTRKDFQSGQEVKWCPGCGDYGVLAQVQNTLPKLGIPRENVVFVSGIGCSSRFPYYMNTYGIHSIHGRAPAVALGVKCARQELSVWVVTGDGDSLSIGTNHLIHCLRRNLDVNILLFNNQIYGLTKGQYSPTSEVGKKTKSSPLGTIEQPIHPVQVALAAEATFVARSLASDPVHLGRILEAAARHKGTSFIEILQNCLVFNDGAFENYASRDVRDEHRIILEHGQPIRFGKDRRNGIVLRSMEPQVATIGENGVQESDLLVHDTKTHSPALAYLLAALEPPHFPKAFGVFRDVERPTYDAQLIDQIQDAVKTRGRGDMSKLLNAGTTWTVD
jgi:2-oxoglutarate/2-oxoacid ferredoxin oxidoreductase subunit beta